MKNLFKFFVCIACLHFFSCGNSETTFIEDNDIVVPDDNSPTDTPFFYKGADISYYPRIKTKSLTFYNRNGAIRNFLQILKENGVNTIRLRLWHNPVDEHASFAEVAHFSKELKRLDFKVWLTVHYSDSWADPGKQKIPEAWENLPFSVMKDSLYNYTSKIMAKIEPDIIQIGNEIDPGMLLPVGNIQTNRQQFLGFLKEGIAAVRNHNSETKIMIHKADARNASWFFDIVKLLDYDLIGVSYYPQWHGKSLSDLKSQLQTLDRRYAQDIVLAETSYPFTLNCNDNTNNVLGDNSQIIYPQFPATLEGQKAYLTEIRNIVASLNKGVGFGYWGAEWVAFEGPIANVNGSVWENQALFDFNLKATPALEVFKD